MDVAAWLRDLGLERYTEAFRANDIDADILPELTAEDLAALGVTSIGHRRKLLAAIAALRRGAAPTHDRAAETTPGSATASVAPPRFPEAERRQLTVMFADLVGSTELAAGMDPEDLRDIIRAYHAGCAAVIERFDGYVAKYLGDGVLAYFGYPQAHEDDAERAVRAGLALVEAVAGLRPRSEAALRVRVGIATGVVVVGDLVGSGPAEEQAVVGETPNLAARLQAFAAPNSVVIAPGTWRLVAGLFDLADLGAHGLKGFAAPVPVWRVLGPSRTEGRFEARQVAGLTPLVGREEELALLLGRWEQAKSGDGQVVLLAGEPGVGKSRLVRALRERLSGEGYTPLRYQCSPYHLNSALYPIVDQLERAADLQRDDGADAKLAKLEDLLGRGSDDIAGVAPPIADLLSIPSAGRYPHPDLTPHRRKELTLAALLAYVEGLTRQRPVLMTFEDAHWSDPTSLELLERVAARVQALPVLLIVIFRPEFQPLRAGRPHVTRLTLGRLSHRQGAALVDGITRGKPLPPAVVGEILAKTDGVPLFVEELTKAVLESGLLRDAGDRYALTGPLPPLAIPATLQDSLTARLDRRAPVKEVAQIGAVIGREFSHELLAAVAPLPEDQLRGALAALVEAELIFRRGAPPDATYTFKHALVQETAYAGLLKSKRRWLHARLADALDERFPDIIASKPDLLAHHCTQAGLIERAVGHWLKAGELALARSATAEAVAQLTKGLKLLGGLSPGPVRDARELDLQLALASAQAAAVGHGMPEARQPYARAVELAEQVGDVARLFPALDGLVTCHFSRAELSAARELAGKLLDLAERNEEVAPRLIAHSEVGIVQLALGNLPSARAHLEQALALYEPGEHGRLRLVYSFDPRVICLGYLSWALFALGYPAQALDQSHRSIAEAERLSHPLTLAFALSRSAAVAHLHRNLRTVEEIAAAVTRLADEQGLRTYMVAGRFYQGWVQVQRGRVDEGLALLRDGLAALRAGGDEDWFPHSLCLVAEAHHKAQQPSAGLDLLDEALERVERNSERWFAAEVHRLRGELMLSVSNADQAETCFRTARAVAREQSARMWELRAATNLARLWRDRGRRTEAGDLLAPVYGWFTEGLDTPDLQEAKGVLDDLG